MFRRRIAPIAVPLSTLIVLTAITLSACTADSPSTQPQPAANLAHPSRTQVFTGSPSEATAEAANATFTGARIAVIAAADDLPNQLRAASLGRGLGAPTLLDGTNGLDEQLRSWGVEQILTVGEVHHLPEGINAMRAPATAKDFSTLTGIDFEGQPLPAITDQAAAMQALTQLPQTSIFEEVDVTVEHSTTEGAGNNGSEIEPLGPFIRPQLSDHPQPDASPNPSASPAHHEPALIVADPATGTVTALANLMAGEGEVALIDPQADPLSAELPVDPQTQQAAAAASAILAVGDGFGDSEELRWRAELARSEVSLPGGGHDLFHHKRYVALYGTPISGALGVLGEQDGSATISRAADQAAQYQALTEDHVVAALEIIVTVAAGTAGEDHNYSNEWPAEDFVPLIEAATAADQYVILDFQPGRSDFLTQVKLYEELLHYPNVGIALDPEWRLGPQEKPLTRIGSVEATEVNQVIDYLSQFVTEHRLPPKMVVLHQFQLQMLRDRDQIDTSRAQTPVLIHADGQGTQGQKQDTWAALHTDAPPHVRWGWKNFIDEDHPMLTPEQTYTQVEPIPDLVTYQ